MIKYIITNKGQKENKKFHKTEFVREVVVKHNIQENLNKGLNLWLFSDQLDELFHEAVWTILRKYPIYYLYSVYVDSKNLLKPIYLGK